MTPQEASSLAPSEQLRIMRDIWYSNAINTSEQFNSTGELKKGLAAATFSRVHRMYLRDQLKFTSIPTAPEQEDPVVKPKRTRKKAV
jgi:hypothetical protein